MRLSTNRSTHVTYCTNIHPGESWSEVREQLEKNLPELKKRLAPDKPFGVGLRLSSKGATELLEGKHLKHFKEWLDREGLYVFTLNGFPYGGFHQQRVKDLVYTPDWRTEKRFRYTQQLIQILSQLLPEGIEGGISTSPISYKPWLLHPSLKKKVFRRGSRQLAQHTYELGKLKEEKGVDIHLDIEPEPDCLLENSRDTIAFYTQHLFPTGSAYLTDKFGIGSDEALDLIRDHIRVCYDTCHFAVEYEDPVAVLSDFAKAGIKVGKTQISAALKVQLNQTGAKRRDIAQRLAEFDEPTYLHQVVERRKDQSIRQYRDLPQALPHLYDRAAEEWRIHFHVPLFVEHFDILRSTRDDILPAIQVLEEQSDCHHFEIETYTWEVLPGELKSDIITSIEREYEWAQTLFSSSVLNQQQT